MGRHVTIPVFVPHSGCPFECIFCNQKNISGQQEEPSQNEVENTVKMHLTSIKPGTEVEIGFFGGSFTGIERSYQMLLLETAYKFVKAGMVKAIRLSTRPDYINTEIINYLKLYGVGTIELGVQSLDDEVLQKSCRGHSSSDVYKAGKLIRDNGINLVLQTMIGLPGDSRNRALETAVRVAEIAPAAVRIYPTLVIKDTYLETLYKEGRYRPLSLDDAADLCSDLLGIYRQAGITVIRMGLQATDNINEGQDVVAGPFHPAFGQIVESRLILKKLVKRIEEMKLPAKAAIIIVTTERNLSNVIGQKRYNINYLKKKFALADIIVKPGAVTEDMFEVLYFPS